VCGLNMDHIVCLWFSVSVVLCILCYLLCFFVSISAIDCLERLVSDTIVSSRTINPAHSLMPLRQADDKILQEHSSHF